MSYLSSKTLNLDPVINYISNGRAYNSTEGWSTYAESDAVTFQDTGDTVTLNSHGLQNGNIVSFTSITSTTGISINTTYYVVSATTNTFQVASSAGGSALPLTTNGSGTMVRFVPKLGTGGLPNVAFNRSTTSPLRQGADFNFVKDAANRMGQGVRYNFTIDNADLAKVLTITFDYEVVSGTYASGDINIFLIQDPTGTPVVIQPTGYVLQAGTVGTKLKAIATFQTSSSATSYRLCLHVSSTSASAYTLAIDNVQVGPQVVQYGAPVTDWQAYTPTFTGFGTCTNTEFYWRRVGSHIEISGKFTTGTTTATEGRITLPSGLSAVSFTQGLRIAGLLVSGYSASTRFGLYTLIESASSYMTFGAQDSGSSGLTKALGTQITSSTVVSLTFTCPIQGWSSTVQMSNDTDTRVVAARYSIAGAVAIGSTQPCNFATLVYDSHNAVTTGSAWKFTAPVPGYYRVSCALAFATTAATIALYKNGVSNGVISTGTSGAYGGGSVTVYLNAGDYIDVRTQQATQNTNSSTDQSISIERLSGPSAIAASETVAARATTAATQSLTTTPAIINFSTITNDTHGAITTGASWKYTAPISGRYRVSARFLSSVGTTAQRLQFDLYKNGSFISVVTTGTQQTTSSGRVEGSGSDTIQLLAGDYIDLRGSVSSGTNSLAGDSQYNFVVIERIGN